MTSLSSVKFNAKVYYEDQESALCGRHCVNNILQGPFFETENLLEIAQYLHEEENKLLEEHNEENYNGDEKDGFFSLSVLERALAAVGLTLERPLEGMNLTEQQCFIVNTHGTHWYSIRKIHNIWVNLNSISLLPGKKGEPMKLTDEELQLKIASLLSENSDVFVVCGDLPKEPDEDIGINSMGKLVPLYMVRTERHCQRMLEIEQERARKQLERAKLLADQQLARAMSESLKDCYFGKSGDVPDENKKTNDDLAKQNKAESPSNNDSTDLEEVVADEKQSDQKADSTGGLKSTFAVKHDLSPKYESSKAGNSLMLATLLRQQRLKEEQELRLALNASLATALEDEERRQSRPKSTDVKCPEKDLVKVPLIGGKKSAPSKTPTSTDEPRGCAPYQFKPHDPKPGHHRRKSSLYENLKIEEDPFMMVKLNLIPAPKNSIHPCFQKFPLKTATVSDVYRKAQERHGTCVLTRGEEVLDPKCDKKLCELFPNKKWCIFGVKQT